LVSVVCGCDTAQCDARVLALFHELLCRDPADAELSARRSDCCNGATAVQQRNDISALGEHISRHNCPGCTASCGCTAGFIEIASVNLDGANGTACQQCPAGTFVRTGGDTQCRPVTPCEVGFEEAIPPTRT
jgi:hypothetical protein